MFVNLIHVLGNPNWLVVLATIATMSKISTTKLSVKVFLTTRQRVLSRLATSFFFLVEQVWMSLGCLKVFHAKAMFFSIFSKEICYLINNFFSIVFGGAQLNENSCCNPKRNVQSIPRKDKQNGFLKLK